MGLFGFFDPLHTVLNRHGPAEQSAVVDTPALHPVQGIAQLLQLGLLLLVLLQLQVKPGLLFIHIERVVAGVELRMAVGDLNDPISYLIDEIAVMGNGQHSTLEIIDIALQPFHAAKIQVVGRLVQQQNVRLFQQ